MKFPGIVLLFILISCKRENIYYYADKKPIKDSTVIRFVDDELKKLKINPEEKNLEVYTVLDSVSYKSKVYVLYLHFGSCCYKSEEKRIQGYSFGNV